MTTALALLAPDRPLLEVVSAFDAETPYQQWRPQILLPAALPPIAAGTPVVMAVVNQKGGAGKTTTTVELAASYAAKGLKVLIIDVDPQDASATSWLMPQFFDGGYPSLLDVFRRTHSLDKVLVATEYDGLWIVPSDQALEIAETDPRITGVEQALKYEIAGLTQHFDVIFIDCGPGLGMLSIGGLIAANYAIITLNVSGLDSRALQPLTETITAIQGRENPALTVRAVVLANWVKCGYARQLADEVAGGYPTSIIGVARATPRAREAPAATKPVRAWEPSNPATSDYDQVADLLIRRNDA